MSSIKNIAIFYCTYKGILSPDEATEVVRLTYIGFVKWSEKQEQ